MLLLHICAGTLGCLSGFIAVFLRKGSGWHARAGTVFAVSMLALAGSGAYMAALKLQPGNILAGSITLYLVATAWLTARRRTSQTGAFDWAALVFITILTSVEATYAVQAALSPTGHKYGYSPGPYIMLGSVAMLATVGDLRMLIRGGVSGTQRIARHLWRMCFAFFIAAASIFLARQHLFPSILRRTGALYFLSLLPIVLMIFWLLRLRSSRVRQRMGILNPAPSIAVPHVSPGG